MARRKSRNSGGFEKTASRMSRDDLFDQGFDTDDDNDDTSDDDEDTGSHDDDDD